MPTFQGMLMNRPRLAEKYDRMTATQKAGMERRFNRKGLRGARRFAKKAVGPLAGRRDLETTQGIIRGQEDANTRAQNQNITNNRLNEGGIFAGRTYGPNGIETTLNPAMQSRMDAVANYTPVQADDAARQRIEGNIMNAWDKRNAPIQAREEENFRQRMADQGIPEGSTQYQEQYSQMKAAQSDARLQEQSAATQLGEQGMNNQFNRQTTAQNQPFQQMQSMAGTQGSFNQGFNPTYTNTINPVDVTTPAMGMYEYNTMEPRRHDWKMAEQGQMINGNLAGIGMSEEGANNRAELQYSNQPAGEDTAPPTGYEQGGDVQSQQVGQPRTFAAARPNQFQQYLGAHQRMANNYSTLNAAQQQRLQNTFRRQGAGAYANRQMSMLNRGPR